MDLLAANRDLLEKLNRLMARALTPPINDDPRVDDAFAEKADLYDQFLQQEFHDRASFNRATLITLNYDCLLERAICRVVGGPGRRELQCECDHVDYHLCDGGGGIELLKPHGSINWVVDPIGGNGTLQPDESLPPSTALGPQGVWTYKKIRVVETPQDEPGENIVAHYARGKAAQANPSTLEQIRLLSNERARVADEVVVIGLHLPDDPADDPPLLQLLEEIGRRANRGCRVVYVSPDEGDRARARTLGFTAVAGTFEEYVATGGQ